MAGATRAAEKETITNKNEGKRVGSPLFLLYSCWRRCKALVTDTQNAIKEN